MGLHTTNPPPTSPTHGPNRYKTLPATATPWPNRYKTLPARPKTPKSGHFKRAGRIFSRFHHQSTTHPVQNSPSNSHPRAQPVQNSPSTPKNTEIRPFLASRENFLPLPTPINHSPGTKLSRQQPPPGPTGTKLSPHAHLKAHPAQNSPRNSRPRAQPVQNSPSTPKNTKIRPFQARRENFLPLPTPRHRAGRISSRFQHQSTTHPVQNSPSNSHPRAQPVQNSPSNTHPLAHPVQNSPSTPKNTEIRPFLASRENFIPVPPPRHRAGRIFSRFQHHLGAYFNAADRLVPTFTQAPDQCAPELGIVRVIGCSSRCSSRTRRD